MKKLLVLLLAAVMALTSAAALADAADFDPELVKAAQADGELRSWTSRRRIRS